MAGISQRTMMIAGISALVIAAFALGYLLGSKSTKAPVESISSISPSDMRGAFGNRPIAPEETQGAMAGMGAQSNQGSQVGSLGGLVAGLEKKVAANPGNIDQQLLLARTYQELGERSKGLKLLRSLHQSLPGNMEVNVNLATLLMTGSDKKELQEAYQLLENATQQKPEIMPMARLYQGDIQVKLGDASQAVKIWKNQLARMPAGTEQRSIFQERIAQNIGK